MTCLTMEAKLSQKLAPLLLPVLCVCCATAQAVRGQATPRYEDYAVAKIFKGKPARPLLSSNPQARNFRTRLREGAAEGPNFAGHYTIVTWGCGSGCEQLAIIDAQTGRVFFPKGVSTISYNMMTDPDEAGLKYKLNSRLLVIVGWPDEATDPGNLTGTFYYEWVNNRFKLVHAVKKK